MRKMPDRNDSMHVIKVTLNQLSENKSGNDHSPTACGISVFDSPLSQTHPLSRFGDKTDKDAVEVGEGGEGALRFRES